jgi:type I restriction enzyme S subunit
VYWWLKGSKGAAERLASGTTFLEISGANAKKIPIPIAPLEQQQEIIAEIEKQFSRLDESVANLKQVTSKVKSYRNSARDSIYASEPLCRQLGSLLREPLRNGHSAKAVSGVGVPTLTLSAVTEGDFSDRNVKQTSANPDRVRDIWVKKGDIFVERSNTPELVGTARLYRGKDDRAIFPDLLIRVRVAETVLPEWVELCLLSPSLRRYFKSRAQGIAGTMPKIDQAVVNEALIPVPPVAAQKRLIAEVEHRFAVVAELEAQARTALARAARLRHAILASAFRGGIGVPRAR